VAPKRELVRIAVAREEEDRHGQAVLDPAGTMPGRGAYLCRGTGGQPTAKCLRMAMRRGGLARALRRPVSGLAGATS
jgi:predicted RNA-binding protein YlxR (DUF448 family)